MHSKVSVHGGDQLVRAAVAMHTSICTAISLCRAVLASGLVRWFRSLNLCDAGAQAFCVLWGAPSRGPMGSRVAGATPLARAEGVNTRTVKPRVRVAKS